jgi:hypothetical protein
MKQRLFFIALCVLVLFLFKCGGGDAVVTEPSGSTNLISSEQLVVDEEGRVWVVSLYRVSYDEVNNPPEAMIKIRNELDRNITLDFDGPSHYVVSIGDKKTHTLTLQPGTYNVMASSPGLKYVPRDYGITVEAYTLYEQVWKLSVKSTKYRDGE